MTLKKIVLGWFLISILVVGMIGFFIANTLGAGNKPSVISADMAVSQALLGAQDDGLFGGIVGKPSKIQGKLMTLDQASQLTGSPIGADTLMAKMRNKLVWLIVLDGKFVEHVPEAPGRVPAKDIMHTQMALIIDANTADIMEKRLTVPGYRVPTTSLQVLSVPSDATILLIPTEVTLPTDVPLLNTGP